MTDIIAASVLFMALTSPASPYLSGRAPRWAWIAWAAVCVTIIVALTGYAVHRDAARLDRLDAIDRCTSKGRRAIASRDGWWCETPGAQP